MNIYSNNIEVIANLIYFKNNLMYEFLEYYNILFKENIKEINVQENDIIISNNFNNKSCSNFNNIEELLIYLDLPSFICDQEEIQDIINNIKEN